MSGDSVKRGSAEYAEFVAAVSRRDVSCRFCGSSENLHVHHLIPFEKNESLRVDPSNGILICEECHGVVHGRKFRTA
jgi:5-methylcytosine-specific restriction endonuclease McrA